LIQTLKNHVVSGLLLILNKLKLVAIALDHKWISSLADLTLKSLPEEATEVG